MTESEFTPPPRLPNGWAHVERIGGGGFADVHLYEREGAVRRGDPRSLKAVKFLRPSVSAAVANTVVAEAGMAADFRHPHIVTVRLAVQEGDLRYLEMDYYPGGNLLRRCRGQVLPVQDLLRYGIQVCGAVHTMHVTYAQPMYHCDIKPANILLDAAGDAVLTDFGISEIRLASGSSDDQRWEALSRPYSAPELFDGQEVTVATEVYALGATLYTLATSRTPFFVPGQTTSDLVRAVRTGRRSPWERSDLPRAFTDLVDACLSRDPRDRPRSALDLARGLQDLQRSLRLPVTTCVVGDGSADLPGRPAADGVEVIRRALVDDPAEETGGDETSLQAGPGLLVDVRAGRVPADVPRFMPPASMPVPPFGPPDAARAPRPIAWTAAPVGDVDLDAAEPTALRAASPGTEGSGAGGPVARDPRRPPTGDVFDLDAADRLAGLEPTSADGRLAHAGRATDPQPGGRSRARTALLVAVPVTAVVVAVAAVVLESGRGGGVTPIPPTPTDTSPTGSSVIVPLPPAVVSLRLRRSGRTVTVSWREPSAQAGDRFIWGRVDPQAPNPVRRDQATAPHVTITGVPRTQTVCVSVQVLRDQDLSPETRACTR